MEDLTRRSIKLLEGGFRSKAYVDARGKSIGFGHFIKKGEEHLYSTTMTPQEGEALLTKDIDAHQSGLKKWAKRPMSDLKKAAITSLAYNTGAESKAVKRVLDLYNEGKDAEAAAVFAEYNKAYNPDTGRTEVNPGLVKRREFEKQLFTASGDVDIDALYKETIGGGKARAMSIAQTSGGARPGRVETAMGQNKDVYAQLQQLNLGLQETGFGNSEFMQRLRREGGSGGNA